ncbi:hypothetical protein D1872_293100 [compost metagenome]
MDPADSIIPAPPVAPATGPAAPATEPTPVLSKISAAISSETILKVFNFNPIPPISASFTPQSIRELLAQGHISFFNM